MTVEILRIYEDYVAATFTLLIMLENGLRLLVAPNFRNRSKKYFIKRGIECLSDVFTRLRGRTMACISKVNRWSFARRGTTKTMDEKSIIRGLEFNRIIIVPFALVGYESGNGQLGATHPASRASAGRVGATRLVGYLPSRNKRGLME